MARARARTYAEMEAQRRALRVCGPACAPTIPETNPAVTAARHAMARVENAAAAARAVPRRQADPGTAGLR